MKQKLKNQITDILFNWIVKESIDENECVTQLMKLLEQEFEYHYGQLISYLMDNVNCQEITFDKMKLIIAETIESWEEEILTDVENLYDDAPEPNYKYAY